MQNHDFSDLFIDETKYYNKNTKCARILEKKGINTVEELFNKELMHDVFIKQSVRSKVQLNTLISLIKHLYLGEDMPNLELLDETIEVDSSKKYLDSGFWLNNLDTFYNPELFLAISEQESKELMNMFISHVESPLTKDKYKEEIKVIDFIKYVYSKKDILPDRYIVAAEAYYEDYKYLESNKLLDENSIKEKIEELEKERDSIDQRIEELNKQLIEIQKVYKKD